MTLENPLKLPERSEPAREVSTNLLDEVNYNDVAGLMNRPRGADNSARLPLLDITDGIDALFKNESKNLSGKPSSEIPSDKQPPPEPEQYGRSFDTSERKAELVYCAAETRGEGLTGKSKQCADAFAQSDMQAMAKLLKDLPAGDRAAVLNYLNDRYKDSGVTVASDGNKLEVTRLLRDKGRSSGAEKYSIDLRKPDSKPLTERSESFGQPLIPCDSAGVAYGLKMRLQEAERRHELSGPVDEVVEKTKRAVEAISSNDRTKDAKIHAFGEALDRLANSAYDKGGSRASAWEYTREALTGFCREKGLQLDCDVAADGKTAVIRFKTLDQKTGKPIELKATFTPDHPNPRPITPVIPPAWKR